MTKGSFLTDPRATVGWPFDLLQREIGRVFDDVGRRLPAGGAARFDPAIDVAETESSIEITAELPGLAEKDVDVSLTDDLLTIKGEKKTTREEKNASWHVEERSFGSFQRTMRLPFRPDADAVAARFEAGVLHVSVPKPKNGANGTRKIEVKGAA